MKPLIVSVRQSGPCIVERVNPLLIIWIPHDAKGKTIITIKRCKRLFNLEWKHELRTTKDIYMFPCFKFWVNYLLLKCSAVLIKHHKLDLQGCNLLKKGLLYPLFTPANVFCPIYRCFYILCNLGPHSHWTLSTASTAIHRVSVCVVILIIGDLDICI